MSAPDGTAPGRRVLVVDDSLDTTRMLKILLMRRGFEAEVANDGPEALDVAAWFRPEVVLLDLTLPGMTGQEVALALRGAEATAAALIVAVTGYGDLDVPAGFDHLLVKPLDYDALFRLLADRPRDRGGEGQSTLPL